MSDLEQVRERINIVDLISESVPLKKAGRNFKGLCPFHNEKTPSFVVSAERQIWHCFGCGKGGDAFTFLMELERLEFPEALKILADRVGVKLETYKGQTKSAQIREKLLSMHHLASEYYHYLLTKHQVGARARRYLKERGVSDALIKTFGLGFAPSAWDNVGKFLHKKGFTDKDLELGGLALMGRSGFYDRFRARIIFPLKNHRGETIAFSGRLLEKDVQEAKYINSPETPLYTKGNTLYGLDVTKDEIRKQASAVIVEGEFDVVSSYQAGVANIVAIKGSALTEAQVSLIKRFCEKIVLALDRDIAGDAASRRGIEIADKAGLDIRIVSIPSGKDPDEAARENPDLWKKAVKETVSYYDFLIDSAFARFKSGEAFDKKKISDEILPVVAKIENTIVQAHYIRILASRLGVPEEKVNEALRKVKTPLRPKTGPAEETQVVKGHDELLEEHLLALVLQSPDLKLSLESVTQEIDPSDLAQGLIRRIFIALVDFVAQNKEMTVNIFVATLPQELVATVDRAYLSDKSSFIDQGLATKELKKTVLSAKRSILRRKIKKLASQISKTEAQPDEGLLENLSTQLRETIAALKPLS